MGAPTAVASTRTRASGASADLEDQVQAVAVGQVQVGQDRVVGHAGVELLARVRQGGRHVDLVRQRILRQRAPRQVGVERIVFDVEQPHRRTSWRFSRGAG